MSCELQVEKLRVKIKMSVRHRIKNKQTWQQSIGGQLLQLHVYTFSLRLILHIIYMVLSWHSLAHEKLVTWVNHKHENYSPPVPNFLAHNNSVPLRRAAHGSTLSVGFAKGLFFSSYQAVLMRASTKYHHLNNIKAHLQDKKMTALVIHHNLISKYAEFKEQSKKERRRKLPLPCISLPFQLDSLWFPFLLYCESLCLYPKAAYTETRVTGF